MNDVVNLKIKSLQRDQVPLAQGLARRVWEEVFYRDMGHRIDFPLKPEIVFHSYMLNDPDGCLGAWNGDELVGAAYAHAWGSVGWIGPMEVEHSWQGQGLGTILMTAAERYLRDEGCDQIGLEAMSGNGGRVPFYERRGYHKVGPAPFLEKRLGGVVQESDMVMELSLDHLQALKGKVDRFDGSVRRGLDQFKEARGTLESGIGKVMVWTEGGEQPIRGMVVLHTEGVRGLGGHMLRLLVTDPTFVNRDKVTSDLLASAEAMTFREHGERIFFTTTVGPGLLELLISRQYRILGCNERMIKGVGEIGWWDGNIISWTG